MLCNPMQFDAPWSNPVQFDAPWCNLVQSRATTIPTRTFFSMFRISLIYTRDGVYPTVQSQQLGQQSMGDICDRYSPTLFANTSEWRIALTLAPRTVLVPMNANKKRPPTLTRSTLHSSSPYYMYNLLATENNRETKVFAFQDNRQRRSAVQHDCRRRSKQGYGC
jgi:hypothetical protein